MKITFNNNKNKDVSIVTWNVRSIYYFGATITVTDEGEKYKLDLIAIQETKLPSEGEFLSERYTFFYGGNKNSNFLGTGFLVKNKILSAVKDFTFVSDRVSYIVLQALLYKYVFINVHCLTQDKGQETKDNFYGKLEELYDQVSSYEKF